MLTSLPFTVVITRKHHDVKDSNNTNVWIYDLTLGFVQCS